MAELVAEGKGRHICLSEAGAATAALSRPGSPRCRASSPWTRGPEREILPTARALGVALVAYSPLGRGPSPAP